jgi:hypothetical protein
MKCVCQGEYPRYLGLADCEKKQAESYAANVGLLPYDVIRNHVSFSQM